MSDFVSRGFTGRGHRGDVYFGDHREWLVVVAFPLWATVIWGLLRWRVAGKFP